MPGRSHLIADCGYIGPVDYSVAVNVRHWWKLPRRHTLAREFLPSPYSRITREGRFALLAQERQRDSLFGQYDQAVNREHGFVLALPDDDQVFRRLLHDAPRYDRSDTRYALGHTPPYAHSALSDKGRYLTGILGLFGGLSEAYCSTSSV